MSETKRLLEDEMEATGDYAIRTDREEVIPIVPAVDLEACLMADVKAVRIRRGAVEFFTHDELHAIAQRVTQILEADVLQTPIAYRHAAKFVQALVSSHRHHEQYILDTVDGDVS